MCVKLGIYSMNIEWTCVLHFLVGFLSSSYKITQETNIFLFRIKHCVFVNDFNFCYPLVWIFTLVMHLQSATRASKDNLTSGLCVPCILVQYFNLYILLKTSVCLSHNVYFFQHDNEKPFIVYYHILCRLCKCYIFLLCIFIEVFYFYNKCDQFKCVFEWFMIFVCPNLNQ